MARHFEKDDNDYLDAGNPSALNLTGDKVTLLARMKLESISGEGKIVSKWADAGDRFQYLLSTDGGDKCLFAINASSQKNIVGTTTLVIGNWYDIAGVYDGSEMRVYCYQSGIGGEENSTSQSGNMPSTTAPFRIGAGSGGLGTENPYDGDISHIAVYGGALSESEIESWANGINVLQLNQDNLIDYWPLNGQNPEPGIVGGNNLTVFGATVTEEPPIPNSIKSS